MAVTKARGTVYATQTQIPRSEVKRFSGSMEKKLRETDYRGEIWRDCDIETLVDGLAEKVATLKKEVAIGWGVSEAAADVANHAMMISDWWECNVGP